MNLKHGYDFKESLNMDKYEGDWCRGLQEEKGKYQCENENSYVGEQRNGRICGKGKLHWVKGNGTFECPDGSFYVWNWSKDPKEQNEKYHPHHVLL